VGSQNLQQISNRSPVKSPIKKSLQLLNAKHAIGTIGRNSCKAPSSTCRDREEKAKNVATADITHRNPNTEGNNKGRKEGRKDGYNQDQLTFVQSKLDQDEKKAGTWAGFGQK